MTRSTLCQFFLTLAMTLFLAHGALADAVLTQVSGAVEVGRGEPADWSQAILGDVVAPNDRVRTGADGRVEIKMDAGTLRVHENSLLRLPPAVANADQVELEQGRSLFDVLRRGGRRFEVHTPTVVVSVKGTRFGVDAGVDIGEVTVYRGTVGVREVGASDMMETLVREGFLATGGVGVPVELDVSAADDPWRSWQEFDRARDEDRKRPERMGEMDRAKATLHRATAADVIVKAAERRPEVAKRLAEIQKKRHEQARKRGDATAAPMPAAPDFGGDVPPAIERQTLQRNLSNKVQTMQLDEMRQQVIESNQVIDAERTDAALNLDESIKIEDLSGIGTISTNPITFDFAAVYELSPEALLLVRDSLADIETSYEDGSFIPTSSTDLLDALNRELIIRGMTSAEAFKTVQVLTGS